MRRGGARVVAALLAIGLLATGLLAAPDAPADQVARWYPAAPGVRWRFRLHRDRLQQQPGAERVRSFASGHVVRSVAAAPGAPGRLVVRSERRERWGEADLLARGEREEVEHTVERWRIGADGLFVLSRSRAGGTPVVFDPPLAMLSGEPTPGRRWSVGPFQAGAIAAPLEGEVLGDEDVEVGGETRRGCRHVRYTGPVRAAPGQGAAPLEGELVWDVWLCRGIGPVREVVRLDYAVASAAGSSGAEAAPRTTSDVLTLTLESHTAGDDPDRAQ